jgi:isopentenyl-diphosphate Delta-isomerase
MRSRPHEVALKERMDEIVERKADHLRLATADGALARIGPGFDNITLVHDALPEVDFDRLDPSTRFLDRRLALPLVIASMTGGHPEGARVNETLARAAERHGLAMGVGSQRAALRDARLRDTYAVAREAAPTAFLLANVGAAQLVPQGDQPAMTTDEVAALAAMIRADAVIVHLNALQELVQPEGDRRATGWLAAITRLARDLPLPIVAKETGGGISQGVAVRLAEAGVAAIDVGGRGGTSFSAIEGLRAAERGDRRGANLGTRLADWGIPTAASIVLAARAGLPIIATGGVRSGVDAARAIALGAVAVGVARPLLQAVLDDGDAGVDAWVADFRQEFLAAMFLTGSANVATLAHVPIIVSGATEHLISAASDGRGSP